MNRRTVLKKTLIRIEEKRITLCSIPSNKTWNGRHEGDTSAHADQNMADGLVVVCVVLITALTKSTLCELAGCDRSKREFILQHEMLWSHKTKREILNKMCENGVLGSSDASKTVT